jgi:hypothetical protein
MPILLPLTVPHPSIIIVLGSSMGSVVTRIASGFSFPPAYEFKKLCRQVFYLHYYDDISCRLIVTYQRQIKYEGIVDSWFIYRRLHKYIGFITSNDSIMLNFDVGSSWGGIDINLQ